MIGGLGGGGGAVHVTVYVSYGAAELKIDASLLSTGHRFYDEEK